MKEKKNHGFESQSYEAPHAESVAIAQESILCSSSGEPLEEGGTAAAQYGLASIEVGW